MIFFEIFCHKQTLDSRVKSIMTNSAANRPKALSPGAPSPRSGGVSPPPQGGAKRCRGEGTMLPERSRRKLPDCFKPKPQKLSRVFVPSQEEAHRRAKRGRRVSVYVPAERDVGEIKCREETASPELPPRSGSGAPEAQTTQEQDEPPSPESPPRSGSGAPEVPSQEEAHRRAKRGRRVLTPSNSDGDSGDDEPPSPPLLGPKRPLSPSVPPSQEFAHRKAKKHRQRRVVSSLPDIVHEGPIEVFFDGVPSQEEVHAAAKRRGSMRRGSSPLRELSPDPSGGRFPEATKRLVELF